MKGDIAVAGLMITADEWQALDPASRALVVAVITRRDDPSAIVAPAILAEGSNPSIDVSVAAATTADVPEVVEELPSSAVCLIETA
ncbi:MAG: hypothetical protein ACKV2T_10185 [Kofleriaceae bacterium]